ncbi:MAG: hypothetical protein ACWGPS_05170 [Candidatus Promineifilaceae bacterium]
MNPPEVPTGNTVEIVRRYYEYLYTHYLSKIAQNYTIHWDVILWVLFWLFVMAAGFFAYTRWQRTTRAKDEPYPTESYNGYIQEGNGPVGTFLILFFIGMFLVLVGITISNLLYGQVY